MFGETESIAHKDFVLQVQAETDAVACSDSAVEFRAGCYTGGGPCLDPAQRPGRAATGSRLAGRDVSDIELVEPVDVACRAAAVDQGTAGTVGHKDTAAAVADSHDQLAMPVPVKGAAETVTHSEGAASAFGPEVEEAGSRSA